MARNITRLVLYFLRILALLTSQPVKADSPIDFMLGTCELGAADAATNSWPKLCVRTSAEIDLSLESQTHQKSRQLGAFGYLGTHFSQNLSLHVRGGELVKVPSNAPIDYIKQPSRLFMQLGNPTAHSLSLLIGKIDAPFGLHKIWLPEFYRHQYQSESHWLTAPYGVRLSAGNSHRTLMEIGLTRQWMARYMSEKDREFHAAAIRLFHDIAAVGRTRIVASALATTVGERRLGAAALIQTNEKSEFALEWVRTYQIRRRQLTTSGQLAKFSLEFPNERSDSYFFAFEDESGVHWLTTLGYRHSIMRHLHLNGILSFRKSQSPDTSDNFIFSLGSKAWL